MINPPPAPPLPFLPDGQLQRYRAFIAFLSVLFTTRSSEEVVRVAHAQFGQLFTAPLLVLAWRRADGGWFCQAREGSETYESIIPPREDGLFERVLAGTFEATGSAREYAESVGLTLHALRDDDDNPWSESWMGTPIVIAGEARGVLSLQAYERDVFFAEDLELFRLVAAHLGIAFENAELHEQLRSLAQTDALTLLPNRSRFRDELDVALASAARTSERLAVVFIDLDDFKIVNDSFGHHSGDALLREVARRLRSAVRSVDSVARLGGDEFTVLLREVTARDELDTLAARLLMALTAPVALEGGSVGVSASLGISVFPEDGSTADALQRRADAAMYRAKRAGKNQYRFAGVEE